MFLEKREKDSGKETKGRRTTGILNTLIRENPHPKGSHEQKLKGSERAVWGYCSRLYLPALVKALRQTEYGRKGTW